MRISVDEATLPPNMAGAWHVNAHTTPVAAPLDASHLVSAVFGMPPKSLTVGETLKTIAGRFHVETADEEPGFSRTALSTGAPGLTARLGIDGVRESDGKCSVVLYTSVHPHSWVGRFYFRAMEPLHHLLIERVLLPRVRRRAPKEVNSRAS